ncbi:hypothetical protein BN77_p11083 [Rhizobium mesoamericanum STM3625]|uniref:Uncharacterized protein n=1 Tax=Rhizobium mesoamericanum STM3625 TaxID=1211777 RepID=K0Q2H9_9HYPH|nr:hypothetical protein BN77_p11083 [Rhizobium mesoamericanum STM3625]
MVGDLVVMVSKPFSGTGARKARLLKSKHPTRHLGSGYLCARLQRTVSIFAPSRGVVTVETAFHVQTLDDRAHERKTGRSYSTIFVENVSPNMLRKDQLFWGSSKQALQPLEKECGSIAGGSNHGDVSSLNNALAIYGFAHLGENKDAYYHCSGRRTREIDSVDRCSPDLVTEGAVERERMITGATFTGRKGLQAPEYGHHRPVPFRCCAAVLSVHLIGRASGHDHPVRPEKCHVLFCCRAEGGDCLVPECMGAG